MKRNLLVISLLLVLLIPFIETRSEEEPVIKSKEFIENYSMRGQTYRHWYNESSGEYRYSSDQLVYKSGIIDDTNWVTTDEYPYRFILRLTDGSIIFFETPDEIKNFISWIDNSSIWAVGYESFSGVFGFYLNFADTDWGHAQYLYWPRLKNGRISAYNQPLYIIFPHLYVKVGGVWYDKILNDRNLYGVDSDPRNNLHFFDENNVFGIYITTSEIKILSSAWDIVQGFKYDKTNTIYHMITQLRCNNRNFDDLGMAYEITSSPQSDNTPFRPEKFRLSNDSYELELNINRAWEASAYLGDFYSSIEVISQNNESFAFTFEDMEQAGFTEKYLNVHDQQLPNGGSRLTLRAGMYGYGEYSKGTWIKIDPTFNEYQITDAFDLYGREQLGVYSCYDLATFLTVGAYTSSRNYRGSIAWDTGITDEITSTSDTGMTIYLIAGHTFEANEYVKIGLYDKGDEDELWDETEGLANPQGWWDQSMYWSNASFWNPVGSGTKIWLDCDISQIIDQWVTHHNVDPSGSQYIPLLWQEGTGVDPNSADRAQVRESSWTTPSQRPRLHFDYVVPEEEEGATVTVEEHDPIIQEPPVWFTWEFAWLVWTVMWAGAGIIAGGLVLYYFFKHLLDWVS